MRLLPICKHTIPQNSSMRIHIQPQYRSEADFIARLPHIFDTEGKTIYAGRNMVKSFTGNYGEWIVKRYKKPNFIQRVVYTFFRKSKALRAYLFAGRLGELGIDTPEGVAVVECNKCGLFHTGYFISTACHDASLYAPLVAAVQFDKSAASALAAFLVTMHEKGFLHGDLNLSNILYRISDIGTYHFTVIDTNRSVFKSDVTPEECLENLKRVTHRRDLLQYIVRKYAALRGWDIPWCMNRVMQALDKLERKEKAKQCYKSFFSWRSLKS